MGALGAAKNNFLDDVILSELDDLDVEDSDEAELFDLPRWGIDRGNKILVNVDSFGAVGDGTSDDTKAFVDAWKQACSTPKSVLLVPAGRSYLVNATRFRGPCVGILRVQVTLIASISRLVSVFVLHFTSIYSRETYTYYTWLKLLLFPL